MDCPSCGVRITSGAGFCSDCRQRLQELHTHESARQCPRCSRVSPFSAKFCAECGAAMGYEGRQGFLTAAGTLTVIASAFYAVCGIICVHRGLLEQDLKVQFVWITLGFIELLVFGFGLTSGILTLKRRSFPLAVFGQVLVVLFACLLLFWDLGAFLLMGLVPLIFGGTAITFTRTARKAFH